MKNYKIKISLVSAEGKLVFNTMLCIIFQYGWEPVLIKRILIDFETIQEKFTWFLGTGCWAFQKINLIRIFVKLKKFHIYDLWTIQYKVGRTLNQLPSFSYRVIVATLISVFVKILKDMYCILYNFYSQKNIISFDRVMRKSKILDKISKRIIQCLIDWLTLPMMINKITYFVN